MKSIPRISDAEWEIMRIIWRKYPITNSEVIEELRTLGCAWHPNTTRTLLARLVQKKALASQSQGRAYAYTPQVCEADCIAQASKSFLTRVFGGSMEPMLAHFVTGENIGKAEVAGLRKLLDEIEEEGTLPLKDQ